MKRKLLSLLLVAVGLVTSYSAKAVTVDEWYLDTNDEITVDATALDGQVLIATDATCTKLWLHGNAQNTATGSVVNWDDYTYVYVKFEKVETPSGVTGDVYHMYTTDADGKPYEIWGFGKGLMSVADWNAMFALEDQGNRTLWKIEKEEDGYVITNLFDVLDNSRTRYYSPVSTGGQDNKIYTRLFTKASTHQVQVAFDPKKPADVTTFAGANREGDDWTFATPVDLSAYKYLVVTTKNSAGTGSVGVVLTDADGKTAGTSWGAVDITYKSSEAGTRKDLWLDRWNNQNCVCANLAYISEQGFDITKVAKLTIGNSSNVASVCLTNYEKSAAVKGTDTYVAGDHVRANATLSEGKFGTIALKYAAAVSGAEIYTVDEWDGSCMTLVQHEGGLEAGVPYIYFACDFVGMNGNAIGAGSKSDVNFYRLEESEVSGDWSDNSARDNGLVGYYDKGFWPGAGALNGTYLLSQNELHEINGGEINLKENRCFFDPAKYQGPKSSPNAKVRIGVAGAEETAIKNVQNAANDGKIYDMNGREVKSIQKGGMYIMGGMKVLVK